MRLSYLDVLKSVAIIDADETFCYLSKNGL